MLKIMTLKIIITGFGPFGSIKENPSSVLGENLAKTLVSMGYSAQFVQRRTAIKDCQDFYDKLAEDDCVVIHIGVNSGVSRINVEFQGFNEASFSIPDADGAQPMHEKIVDDYPYQFLFKNKLDLDSIVEKMSDSLDASYSAGRYICNYMYFLGLSNVGKKSRGTVFIHIPMFETLPLGKQLKTMVDFTGHFVETVQ